MKTLSGPFIFIFFSAMVIGGCKGEHSELSRQPSSAPSDYILNPNPDPTLATAAANILGPKCASCHGVSGSNTVFLNTSNDPDMDTLAEDTRFVQIGRGSISALYLRSADGTMPPGNPLSATEYDAIKAWIDDLGVLVGDNDDSDDDDDVEAATFAEVESQILQSKCYGCHANNALVQFSDYATVLFTIVTAYDLNSPLLTSTASGSMPKNQTSLTQEELNMITSWIQNGAPND